MARDLVAGDRIRAIGGCIAVKSKADDPDTPVIGLEVAQNHNIFVGGPGLLVHDAGLVQPVDTPFDRVAELLSPATTPEAR
jgi:hypothetical protein